jgi:hypothetical protein
VKVEVVEAGRDEPIGSPMLLCETCSYSFVLEEALPASIVGRYRAECPICGGVLIFATRVASFSNEKPN